MPAWAGTWEGGRYYFKHDRPVYFIERRGRVIRLRTHDPALALGELARFLEDPEGYVDAAARPKPSNAPVYITEERLALYLSSISETVIDHRRARASYLRDWAKHGIDLRRVTLRDLRGVLGRFDGGHRGRVEALNAFARFLVREQDLPNWTPLTTQRKPAATRAARAAYSLEQLRDAFAALPAGPVRDVFAVRAATGMHHTELQQITGAPETRGPLPERGAAVRLLTGKSQIKGVLQVMHKSRRVHRQSVDGPTLTAVRRLRAGVPDRITVWEAFRAVGIVPSNLRHTFVTLAGECGKLVAWESAGVDRSRVAQVIGHRAGSTMTADRYERIQVPPMIVLPLAFP